MINRTATYEMIDEMAVSEVASKIDLQEILDSFEGNEITLLTMNTLRETDDDMFEVIHNVLLEIRTIYTDEAEDRGLYPYVDDETCLPILVDALNSLKVG